MCGRRKYPYPHYGGSLEILRGKGVSKALYVLQSLQVRIESLFVYSLRLDKVRHVLGKSKE